MKKPCFVFKPCVALLGLSSLCACSHRSAAVPVHHYVMTGKVVALDQQHQTATIDAAAIPNYMEAMTMDYPIKNKSDFSSLHVGEQIKGTLDVMSDDTYALASIQSR